MPQISIVNQPFGGRPNRLGDHIADLLSRRSDRFDAVYIAAAFAKASGVAILFDLLRAFTRAGGRVVAAIGIDQQGTSRQGLELLLRAGVEAFVFHNPGAQTFHSKYYLFHRDKNEGVALVGSNNLTRGGLYENFEFTVRLDHDLRLASDAEVFQRFLDSFKIISDVTSGMAINLDRTSLKELARLGYLFDESRRSVGEEGGRLTVRPGPSALFRRVPMPRGPRPTRRVAVPVSPPQPGQALQTFIMTLGTRDTRQLAGYSRDIFVPITARQANAAFWDWPTAYSPPAGRAGGNYLERRVDMLVTPKDGPTQLITGVGIYAYAERDEFRVNCSELVRDAHANDILVISRVRPGNGYDYEATVIAQIHPMYSAFYGLCTNSIPRSGRRWGYS